MTSFLQRARGAAGSFSYAQYEKEISLPTPRLCKKTIGKGDKKMKSKKAVRSALGMSVLSIALCAAMLIGTTFAWFTDTASTAVNKIQAGTLDVALEMKDSSGNWVSAEGKTLDFVKAEGAGDEEILWEPGCTYNLPELKIVNNGNLALKYMIKFTGIKGDAKLNEVIEWTIEYGAEAAEKGGEVLPGEYVLLPAGDGDELTISGHMKETAGNEYQGLSIDGIAITVYATQYIYEYDSNGKDYDENATYYPVLDAAGLKDALVNGGNIRVDSDVVPTETLVVEKNTTLDMNGSTIANETDLWNDADGVKTWSLISARGAGLTIDGNGTFQAKKDDCYAVDVQDGANVVIENGTFIGNIHAVYVLEGTLTVKGGFFAVQQKYPDATKANEFVLNCYDANYKAQTASIVVTGGTFVNFNPANCKAEGEGTNFVADGYSVVSEKHGNDTWYTVVKGTGVTPGTQEDLNNGIENATEKDVTVVIPKNSSFTLDNGIAHEGTKSRDITFVGDGTQTVDVASKATAAEGANHLNYQRGSTFTFKNLTIENGTDTYDGIVCDELVYENCTIKGVTTLYGKATFINCTFDNTMANQYSIWTWGGTDVKFEGCTFNTNGKAILLFGEEKTTNLTVDNCTFNDRKAGTSGKAAIEVGEANYGKHNNFTLVINNATVNGFAVNTEGTNTGTTLWANKNSMDAAHLTVIIDGTKVQ
ncbi:MAG: TasA family protein [Clostridia bacterium]|nr:TasA family protein [Clostridia bacterium]MDY2929618.1 TasA family protein [Clostridiaceae bacterium]